MKARDEGGIKGAMMVQAMDQLASEGALEEKSVGSVSKCMNDGWYNRWIREQSKALWIVQAMDP